ncbi:MAG TPA: hypothetical protein VFU43_02490 [Streptosporangiaceae bacterium]|nr:hypothetical protein [Streptosporangiaceae bacterium]
MTAAQAPVRRLTGTGFMGAAHGQGLAGPDPLKGGRARSALVFVREHAIEASAAAFDAAFSVTKENTDD